MAGIKKKVDVLCSRTFNIGVTPFRGNCTGIILDADGIRACLENKAIVKEVLKNGRRYPLDFTNYNKRNPMGFDVEGQTTENFSKPGYSVSNIGPSSISANQPPVAMLRNTKATDTGALQAVGVRSQAAISDAARETKATQHINAPISTTNYEGPKEIEKPAPETSSYSTPQTVIDKSDNQPSENKNNINQPLKSTSYDNSKDQNNDHKNDNFKNNNKKNK